MDRIEIDEMIRRASDVTERLKLMRTAWEMADSDKDYDAQIKYRLDYIHDCCFYHDTTEIYIIFPEVLKLYDTHLKEYGYDNHTRDIMWDYKWLLENAIDFYQISVRQFETLWEDCKKRYIQNELSLRPLYEYKFVFYINIDKEKAAEAYKEFYQQKRDSMSDCHACERAKEVEYFLGMDEVGKAAMRAQPMIDGELKCGEEPECTLGRFLRYYNGRILEGEREYVEPAENICESLRKTIDRKGTAIVYMADVLWFYAMEKPEKALAYYKKKRSFFETNRNPVNKYWFAIATLVFLHNLKDKETYKMELDPSFPLYNQSDEYCVAELENYYQEKASDIASKMDMRNGTDIFCSRLQKILKQLRSRKSI